MSKVTRVEGRGIPLIGNDIDTDRIIPARFLRCVTFDGLGEQVFADDRAQLQGKHPFDLPQYQGANILVVNGNFGCGSSREHAPQAIMRWGIQALIGESFAEIFLGNCITNGIPCATAAGESIQQLQQLLQSEPQTSLNLDLQSLTLTARDLTIAIAMAEGARQSLITGKWDSCGQLVQNFERIRSTATKIPYLNRFALTS
jgi:3-isopropylmalate/(R)-2-methylmalate dehydratase small subunit